MHVLYYAGPGCLRRELLPLEKWYMAVFNLTLQLQLDTESYFHSASAVLLARHRQICAANASQQKKHSTSVINGSRFKVAITSVPILG